MILVNFNFGRGMSLATQVAVLAEGIEKIPGEAAGLAAKNLNQLAADLAFFGSRNAADHDARTNVWSGKIEQKKYPEFPQPIAGHAVVAIGPIDEEVA